MVQRLEENEGKMEMTMVKWFFWLAAEGRKVVVWVVVVTAKRAVSGAKIAGQRRGAVVFFLEK